MALTDLKLRNLKPKEKPYKVFDFGGLFVLVNPSGSKLWRFKYRIYGKEKLLALGAYPAISLQQARTARDEARAQVASNVDPNRIKRENRIRDLEAQGQTFEKVAEAYLNKLEKEGRRASTLKKNRWLLGMASKGFGSEPMSQITPPTVLHFLKRIEAKGQYETANRMRTMIGSVFRFAIASGLAEIDPTYALQGALIQPKATPRSAILNWDELAGLLRSVRGYKGQMTTRVALELLVMFALRPGELRRAEWSEFDFERLVWSVPAERMKMNRIHYVPLTPRPLALIRQLQAFCGEGRLLFPGLRSVNRCISDNTMNAAMRRMGYSSEEVMAHGFRATFSTLANESGLWSPDAIEVAAARKVSGSSSERATYNRSQYWEERVKMADWWTETVFNLGR